MPSACDNCPLTANLNQADVDVDTDVDGVPNGCEVCAGFDDTIDPAPDSVLSDCDSCPLLANFNQADADVDRVGDACDQCVGGDDTLDADADGTPDYWTPAYTWPSRPTPTHTCHA